MKIAILDSEDSGLTFELDELKAVFEEQNIESRIFYESDSILPYQPDCVLVTSPQNAKLTPYPTYGLIRFPRDEYLELPRFLRNILTYDGYLTFSPRLEQMLKDVMFGARKLNTSVLRADCFPSKSDYKQPKIKSAGNNFVIFDPDFTQSCFKRMTYQLLDKFENARVITFSIDEVEKHKSKFILAKNLQHATELLQNAGIALSLYGGDQQEQLINPAVLKIIASSAVTITHYTEQLEKYFGDNLYYTSEKTSPDDVIKQIAAYIAEIESKPEIALEKSRKAQQIFNESLAFNYFLPKFLQMHANTLITKGYAPNPDAEAEKRLPSVTYIMRTGGKHRPFLERALDCLVAQQYPNLHVIFVTHVKVPFINEIIAQYPTLKFKVIESIKSQRSQAIRDGIEAVETDLFGLFDDDDELFPNHVRSLVRTLQYHSNRDWRGEIGMVYSGSIHADDTYPVFERVEFHDNRLINKNEKRAIEHFKFYSSVLMSQHAWFMPNGWLARTKLRDAELLEDPGLDTCEDLYFELQLAQKAHFAFSVEVTAIHNFHHLGNSTIDDSHKHLPDTQRIALRNFSRVFATDSLYDTYYNLVGRLSNHDSKQASYQDYRPEKKRVEYFNQFYPFRDNHPKRNPYLPGAHVRGESMAKLFKALSFKAFGFLVKFKKMDKYKRIYYINAFKTSLRQYGLKTSIYRMIGVFTRQ